MYTSYEFATVSEFAVDILDFDIPDEKAQIIADADREVKEIEDQFSSGLVTQGEKYNKVIDIWSRANELVAKAMMENLGKEKVVDREGNEVDQESFNSVYMM